MPNEPLKIDRYPGIRRFEQNQERIFKGREIETIELFNLVKRERVVVVFAKSGIGKSSIINAGVLPLLHSNNFRATETRFQLSKGENKSIKEKFLSTLVVGNNLPKKYPFDEQKSKLWESWKSYSIEFEVRFPNQTPVLILDQFEEIFYYNRKDRFDFWSEFAEILNDQAPSRILDWVSEHITPETAEELLAFAEQPRIKVIIAIRTDRFGELKEISDFYPILHQTYELLPLSREKAREGIVLPADEKSTSEIEFTSHRYTYDEDALNLILDTLEATDIDKITQTDEQKQGLDGIDTTQLQLICSELEKKIQPLEEIKEITSDFFGGKKGLELLISNFYNNKVNEASQELKININAIKKIIEDYFLIDKMRVSLSSKQLIAYLDEIDKQNFNAVNVKVLLDILIQLRIFRKQDSSTGKVYEIGHDSLITTIANSRDERELREKQAADEQKRIIDEKKKQEEEKQKTIEREKEIKQYQLEKQNYLTQLEVFTTQEKLQKEKEKSIKYKIGTAVAFMALLIYLVASSGSNERKFKSLLQKNLNFQAYQFYRENDHSKAFRIFDYLKYNQEIDTISALKNLDFSICSYNQKLSSDEKYFFIRYPDNNLIKYQLIGGKLHALDTIHKVFDYRISKDGTKILYTDSNIDSLRTLKYTDRRKKIDGFELLPKGKLKNEKLNFSISDDGEKFIYTDEEYIFFYRNSGLNCILYDKIFKKVTSTFDYDSEQIIFDGFSGNIFTYNEKFIKFIELEKGKSNILFKSKSEFSSISIYNHKLVFAEYNLADDFKIHTLDLRNKKHEIQSLKIERANSFIDFDFQDKIQKDKDSSFNLVSNSILTNTDSKLLFHQNKKVKLLDLLKTDTLYNLPSEITNVYQIKAISPDNKKILFNNKKGVLNILYNNELYVCPKIKTSNFQRITLYDNFIKIPAYGYFDYEYMPFMKKDLSDVEILEKRKYLNQLYPELSPAEKKSLGIDEDKSLLQKIIDLLGIK